MWNKFKKNITGWSFISVATIMITIFYFYPMIQTFILSLQSGIGNNLEFVGFKNYTRALSDPTFLNAIKNTIIFLMIHTPLLIALSLVLAVLLHEATLKFKGFFRLAIFLPAVTSSVAYALIFKDLFSLHGLVNKLLLNLSIIPEAINWLNDPVWAKVVIIIALTWRWTGYNMIFYLSGLQNVDRSLYEAAQIDGASTFQQFTKITIPMLKPIIIFTSVTSTIGMLQLFDEVVNITGGGPGGATQTISQYIYNLSFVYTPNFGYAATISYFIVIIVIMLSLLQLILGRDKNE